MLRLVGFRTADIIWFPMVQALFTAVLVWVLVVAIDLITAMVINDMMAGQLETGQQVCRLLPWHYRNSTAADLYRRRVRVRACRSAFGTQ